MTARSAVLRACGGCGFGEGTFAGVSGNDEDAPKAVVAIDLVHPPRSTPKPPFAARARHRPAVDVTSARREPANFGLSVRIA